MIHNPPPCQSTLEFDPRWPRRRDASSFDITINSTLGTPVPPAPLSDRDYAVGPVDNIQGAFVPRSTTPLPFSAACQTQPALEQAIMSAGCKRLWKNPAARQRRSLTFSHTHVNFAHNAQDARMQCPLHTLPPPVPPRSFSASRAVQTLALLLHSLMLRALDRPGNKI